LDPLRLAEHVHGHLGWLAAALLVHPAIVLRDRRRRAHLAVILAFAFVTVASAMGAWIYVAYRDQLRRAIFLSWPAIGLLMERKEHLAFASVVFVWAGTAAYFGAPRAKEDSMRETLRTIAYRAFVCAAALAIVVALLGTIVAVHKSF
jgi:ABC-type Mn2+/Zn2+ transport system permease subunit